MTGVDSDILHASAHDAEAGAESVTVADSDTLHAVVDDDTQDAMALKNDTQDFITLENDVAASTSVASSGDNGGYVCSDAATLSEDVEPEEFFKAVSKRKKREKKKKKKKKKKRLD